MRLVMLTADRLPEGRNSRVGYGVVILTGR